MRLILLLLLVSTFTSLNGQIIKVTDKQTGEPLEFVTITSEDPLLSLVTSRNGEADISTLVNSQLIEIRFIGYSTQSYSYNQLKQLNFRVELAESIFSIDQVVVSATKWNQASREIPLKVVSVSRARVEFNSPQTAADLLAVTGNVFVQKSQQGGGSPMIRGFATNRLLITVDGVRMNNAIFRSGNLQNVISIDPFAVEQTEVLFGPGSVIYGSDAIGGVMSFYTLTPKFKANGKPLVSGSSSVRYSSANNEKTGHIDLNFGWEKWASVTSFSYTNFGHLRMGSFGPDEYLRPEYVERNNNSDEVIANPNPKLQYPSAYSQVNLMQKVSFRPNSNWDITYGLIYSATSNFDRYDRLILYRNGLPHSAEWYYGPQVWMMNNMVVKGYKNTVFYDQVTAQFAHQHFEESRHDRSFNGNTLRSREERVGVFTFNLDMKKTASPKLNLFYGAETSDNTVNSFGVDKNIADGNESIAPSRYPQATTSSFGSYLTFKYDISEKINLQAGARHSMFGIDAQFDNTFYPFPFTQTRSKKSAVTGSAGLTYNPTDQWRVNAILSTGYRAPNVDDMGKVFDSEPGAVVLPNPDLNAEYAYNAEFSITRRVKDFFEVDFLTYYTILDNAMVKRNTTLNGQDSIMYDGVLSQVQSIQNAAFARVWGIQADFELMLPGGFMVASRFNYQMGIEELDDGSISPLRHAAPWFGVSKVIYTIKKIKLEVFVNFSGEVAYENLAEEERGKPHIYATDTNGNPYSPAWYTLNFRSQYQVSKNISLSASIENITDQRYRPYSSGMVAPGINLVGVIRVAF